MISLWRRNNDTYTLKCNMNDVENPKLAKTRKVSKKFWNKNKPLKRGKKIKKLASKAFDGVSFLNGHHTTPHQIGKYYNTVLLKIRMPLLEFMCYLE